MLLGDPRPIGRLGEGGASKLSEHRPVTTGDVSRNDKAPITTLHAPRQHKILLTRTPVLAEGHAAGERERGGLLMSHLAPQPVIVRPPDDPPGPRKSRSADPRVPPIPTRTSWRSHFPDDRVDDLLRVRRYHLRAPGRRPFLHQSRVRRCKSHVTSRDRPRQTSNSSSPRENRCPSPTTTTDPAPPRCRPGQNSPPGSRSRRSGST